MKSFLSALAVTLTASLPGVAQNVGVGTTTPTHGRLEIVAASGNQLVTRTSTTGPGMAQFVNTGTPTLGFNMMSNGGFSSIGKGYSAMFQYDTAEGRLRYFSSVASAAAANTVIGSTTTTLFSLERDGQMGLGVSVPLEGLHLRGRNIRLDNSSSDRSVVIAHTGTSGGASGGEIRLYNHNDTDSTLVIRGADATSQGGEIIFIDPGGTGTTMELDGDYAGTGRSRITVDELQIKGGSDFAEFFDVAPADGVEPEAGMLVSIDESAAGKLVVSSKASDRKVAGVISGAGGVRPGLMMGQGGSVASGAHPVAITGRVFVKADATRRAIRPGDLLTSSTMPGHAAVAGRRTRGAVIGKAMSGLQKGEQGEVLVLLGIQ